MATPLGNPVGIGLPRQHFFVGIILGHSWEAQDANIVKISIFRKFSRCRLPVLGQNTFSDICVVPISVEWFIYDSIRTFLFFLSTGYRDNVGACCDERVCVSAI